MLGFFLFILQTTLLDNLTVLGAKPDLVVVLVVFVAFHHSYLPGAVLAFVFGYLVDLYSSGPLGLNIMGKVLIHYFAFVAVRTVFLNSILLQVITVIIAVLGEGILLFFLRKFVGLPSGPYISFFSFILLKGAYTGMLAPAIFLGIRSLYRGRQIGVVSLKMNPFSGSA